MTYRILGSIILVEGCLSRRLGKIPTCPDADASTFSQWQTNEFNSIDRSSAIIKRFASMFAGNTGVVPVIAPLNESVSCLIELNFDGQFLSLKGLPDSMAKP